MSLPSLTVFTSTVFADVARLWNAAVARAVGRAGRVEIFDDSPAQDLDPSLFPGARLLRRTPERRDFHEAYNDAVRRCETDVLALVDSDVFWLDRALWARAAATLAEPRVAAVSFVSRAGAASHGTFAVALKPPAYREAFAALPGGFFPEIEGVPARPRSEWIEHDTGDLLTRAVIEAGHDVRLLALDGDGGSFVRFDGITLSRRAAGWIGADGAASLARTEDYFFHGWAGSLALRAVHDRTFASGPRWFHPFPDRGVLSRALAAGGGRAKDRLVYLARVRRRAAALRSVLARR